MSVEYNCFFLSIYDDLIKNSDSLVLTFNSAEWDTSIIFVAGWTAIEKFYILLIQLDNILSDELWLI